MSLSMVARSLASVLQLLPGKRHAHIGDSEHCHPEACTVCGATSLGWRERFRDWRDSLHDVFDSGD